MKIVAVADLHGNLPDIPACDLLLIAGDITPLHSHKLIYQRTWLDTVFRDWLASVPATQVIGVSGNHDFIFEEPELVPHSLPWAYLQDSGVTLHGLSVWGTPWQPPFCDWAFNLDDEGRKAKWALVPEGTDILVCHGPPLGYGDLTLQGESVGCRLLLERIRAVNPRLVVCGHIHEGRGVWSFDGARGTTTIANVTLVDSQYKVRYEPWEFGWAGTGKQTS